MSERQFAVDVAVRLKQAGFEAFWAGGCVRDLLLGIEPTDFDVATDAHPQQVRDMFGHRRTLAVGATFGVIIVRSPDRQYQVEVATFRSDASYSDGRRPDSVTFSTPEMDAQRRDFTINGMFYDPIREQVIDYVGGQDDLARKVVRAIGNADDRIGEDKLRMLRAVRFAARFGFEIEAETYEAIRRHAPEAAAVSGERLADEMRKTLETTRPACAVGAWKDTGLLHVLLPGVAQAWGQKPEDSEKTLKLLNHPLPTTAMARLSCLLWPVLGATNLELISDLKSRLRLSNDEAVGLRFSLSSQFTLGGASRLPWSVVQPLLVSNHIEDAVQLVEHRTQIGETTQADAQWLRDRLMWPAEKLDPPPLLTGQDLQQCGYRPSPRFKGMLDQVRARQLDGKLANHDQALDWIKSTWTP